MRLILVHLAADLPKDVAEKDTSPVLLHPLPLNLLKREALLLLAPSWRRMNTSVIIELAIFEGLNLDCCSRWLLLLQLRNFLDKLPQLHLALILGRLGARILSGAISRYIT